MDQFLFDKGPSEVPSPMEVAGQCIATPRLRTPQRDQIEMHWASLDELLEPDHPARVAWLAVGGLDLSRWLVKVKAVEGEVGRNGTDPRLLMALWIYATLQGVGSAREIARLSEKHLAYKWLCGGVTVNHHMISDFRTDNGEAWDELLTQIVGSLLAENLVTMNRVAQDGMRVRAHAGKDSYRRRGKLEIALDEAKQQVDTLKKLADERPDQLSARQRAARERAAKEREQRINNAIRNCDELQQQREAAAAKSGRKPTEARASTTDPEARVMQFSDNGFRPAYNVQFSTDTKTGVIVGVDVSNHGTDQDQLPPMLHQLQRRYGKVPDECCVDGGFGSQDAIEQATELGCMVYAPLKNEKKQLEAGKDPYAKKKGDSPAMESFRVRMGTAAGKVIYKLRCQSAEWVNAMARNRGLQQMPVRGQPKCLGIALLFAIAHNLMQAIKLRTQVAA